MFAAVVISVILHSGSSSSSCENCMPGRCISNTCSLCADGYFSSNNTCFKCGQNCKHCSHSGGHLTCGKCDDGYYVSPENKTCTRCRPNCKQCSSRDTSCDLCNDGYYGANCSSKCLAWCATCDSRLSCTSCPSGWFGTNCDTYCDTNCRNETCGFADGGCIGGCQDEYYADGATCWACPTNCDTCQSHVTCDSCKPGYSGSTCDVRCNDTVNHDPRCFNDVSSTTPIIAGSAVGAVVVTIGIVVGIMIRCRLSRKKAIQPGRLRRQNDVAGQLNNENGLSARDTPTAEPVDQWYDRIVSGVACANEGCDTNTRNPLFLTAGLPPADAGFIYDEVKDIGPPLSSARAKCHGRVSPPESFYDEALCGVVSSSKMSVPCRGRSIDGEYDTVNDISFPVSESHSSIKERFNCVNDVNTSHVLSGSQSTKCGLTSEDIRYTDSTYDLPTSHLLHPKRPLQSTNEVALCVNELQSKLKNYKFKNTCVSARRLTKRVNTSVSKTYNGKRSIRREIQSQVSTPICNNEDYDDASSLRPPKVSAYGKRRYFHNGTYKGCIDGMSTLASADSKRFPSNTYDDGGNKLISRSQLQGRERSLVDIREVTANENMTLTEEGQSDDDYDDASSISVPRPRLNATGRSVGGTLRKTSTRMGLTSADEGFGDLEEEYDDARSIRLANKESLDVTQESTKGLVISSSQPADKDVPNTDDYDDASSVMMSISQLTARISVDKTNGKMKTSSAAQSHLNGNEIVPEDDYDDARSLQKPGPQINHKGYPANTKGTGSVRGESDTDIQPVEDYDDASSIMMTISQLTKQGY